MNNMENRIKREYDLLTENEKYRLMEQLEGKNLGTNDKYDKSFMEGILNIALEVTTIIAKVFHII